MAMVHQKIIPPQLTEMLFIEHWKGRSHLKMMVRMDIGIT